MSARFLFAIAFCAGLYLAGSVAAQDGGLLGGLPRGDDNWHAPPGSPTAPPPTTAPLAATPPATPANAEVERKLADLRQRIARAQALTRATMEPLSMADIERELRTFRRRVDRMERQPFLAGVRPSPELLAQARAWRDLWSGLGDQIRGGRPPAEIAGATLQALQLPEAPAGGGATVRNNGRLWAALSDRYFAQTHAIESLAERGDLRIRESHNMQELLSRMRDAEERFRQARRDLEAPDHRARPPATEYYDDILYRPKQPSANPAFHDDITAGAPKRDVPRVRDDIVYHPERVSAASHAADELEWRRELTWRLHNIWLLGAQLQVRRYESQLRPAAEEQALETFLRQSDAARALRHRGFSLTAAGGAPVAPDAAPVVLVEAGEGDVVRARVGEAESSATVTAAPPSRLAELEAELYHAHYLLAHAEQFERDSGIDDTVAPPRGGGLPAPDDSLRTRIAARQRDYEGRRRYLLDEIAQETERVLNPGR